MDSTIFDYLEKTPKGSGGEIQLTDAMKLMLHNQEFWGYKLQGKRLDCGVPMGFFEANIELALNNPESKQQATEIIKKIASQIK